LKSYMLGGTGSGRVKSARRNESILKVAK
jgi:hypothetical protein